MKLGRVVAGFVTCVISVSASFAAEQPQWTREMVIASIAAQRVCSKKFPSENYTMDRVYQIAKKEQPDIDLSLFETLDADPKANREIASYALPLEAEQCKHIFSSE